MKGGGVSAYSVPAKRRWRWLVIGVLGLVILSMLVPLVFLLGLHNGFHSTPGFVNERQNSASSDLRIYDIPDGGHRRKQPEANLSAPVGDGMANLSAPVDDGMANMVPTIPKDVRRDAVKEAVNKSIPVPITVTKPSPKRNYTRVGGAGDVTEYMQGIDESEKLCELKFGSYCLWRQEHAEKMNDASVKKMKDQLYVARAYYPSIAKLPRLNKLSNEMKQNIQDFERILSESSTDADLPSQIEKRIQKMEATITRAKAVTVDCNNVDKKLRQLVDLTKDEANFHMKQSAFLYQLAVQTMPKSHHCLSMRLTVEYFRSPILELEQSVVEKYSDPELHHYVMFSNNVLASSVVINTTVMNARDSKNQVFHVLTDKQSFFAMKMWFFINYYKEATVQVLNVEDLELIGHGGLNSYQLALPEEFRVSFLEADKPPETKIRTEYISVFSHLHYALPKIFPTLKKVVVLDDDVVVQHDLSALWGVDMDGKVNGAVQFCAVRLGELKNYLGENKYDANSCAWISGLNLLDLVQWRERSLDETYQRLLRPVSIYIDLKFLCSTRGWFMIRSSKEEGFSEAVTLRASLLVFQGLVHALDDTWMLSGLGHNYSVNSEAIKKSAVLHFNGHMKPWLEMGIPSYKAYWRKFLNRENQFLSDCNVNP